MIPPDHRRVREVFERAVDLDPAARSLLLEQACGDDRELRHEVESLLGYHDRDSGVLNDADAGLGSMLIKKTGEADAESGTSAGLSPVRVGCYRINRLIGEGGMGVVYQATQEVPSRTVVVKLLHPSAMSRADIARRFKYEAEILGHLRHPGIAHVYDAGVAIVEFESGAKAKQSYIAMEFVKGSPLTHYAAHQNLDTRERLELIAKTCDAVDHAHMKGIIHRDLKPQNILVDETGQPKVLDFGVARIADSDIRTTSPQTEVGQIIGTLAYMSPEQSSGKTVDVDVRSDVYALGVLLYEILADRLPFDMNRCSIPESARLIQEEVPPDLGGVRSEFRGDVATIVAKAMEKDRARRYQSARALGDDIRRFLHHEPIEARKASAAYQIQRFANRHRGLVIGIGVAALALVVGSAVAVWQAIEARSAQHVAERRFNDLQAFAHSVIVDYQRMQREKGATRAREFLTTTCRKYLDNMATETRGLDRNVLEDLAHAYTEIGSVLGQPNGPNLGDPKAAIASYQQAFDIWEELLARDPADIETNRGLAIICERIGNMHLQERRYEEALAVYQKSHAIKDSIAGNHDNGARDLSFSYSKLGDVYRSMGRTEDAYAMFANSLKIRKTLAESNGHDDEIQRAYTVALNRVGDVLLDLGKPTEALENYRTSLERRIRRAEAQPDNDRAVMDLAVGHFTLAHGLAKVDRLDEAQASFEASREILRKMAASDEGNVTVLLGAAEISGEIGRILLSRHYFQGAIVELDSYVNETEQNMPEVNMTPARREQLATAHQRRGQAYRALANMGEATSEQQREHILSACAAYRRAAYWYRSAEGDGGRLPEDLKTALADCPTVEMDQP